ncbi:MAG: hypothetical protein MJ009_00480 [Paludibacteraceae bacterium]|nr:hypothetical protein [Paludibacteraceae bacterium]
MARTIEKIKQELQEAFMTDATLQEKYGFAGTDKFDSKFSKVSIESILLYIVAASIWTLEKLMDTHRNEVEAYIEKMKPHTLKWYVEKAKAFHYGESLIEGTDKYLNADDAEGVVMPVTFAACSEDNATLYLKVAKSGPAALTENEKSAFESYMREIKDAGVRIDVISLDGDYLEATMTIYYNPLLIDAEGNSKTDGSSVVENAIRGYIENLPFNGEFRNNSLVDALQAVDGVEMVELGSIFSGQVAGSMTEVVAFCTPASGYFKFEGRTTLHITYIAYGN